MNIIVLTEYKAITAKIKEMEKKAEELKTAIISEMEVNTEKRIGQYMVSLKEITRTDIDKKQLETDLPEVFRKYQKETTYNRLTVK